MTAQDIQEKAFEKASRGYNMDQVDEFLDEIAAEISSLSAENASLKGKLKVLVQKVDEYRQTEDSMRLALLSAQKLSSQIESEARERADGVIAEAQQYADRLNRQTSDSIANEEAKLEEAKKATARFFEHMRTVCQKQIEFYDKLGQMQLVGGEPAMPEEPAAVPVPTPAAAPAPAARAPQPVRPDPAPEVEAPQEEDEPTRLYPASQKAAPKKRKRSFDDFSFDEDI